MVRNAKQNTIIATKPILNVKNHIIYDLCITIIHTNTTHW